MAINNKTVFYLYKEMTTKKENWSRACIDLHLYFDDHASSCGENGLDTLKISLGSFVSGLNAVVGEYKTLSDRQRSDYLLELSEAKVRLSSSLEKNMFRLIQALMAFFAMKIILISTNWSSRRI